MAAAVPPHAAATPGIPTLCGILPAWGRAACSRRPLPSRGLRITYTVMEAGRIVECPLHRNTIRSAPGVGNTP